MEDTGFLEQCDSAELEKKIKTGWSRVKKVNCMSNWTRLSHPVLNFSATSDQTS